MPLRVQRHRCATCIFNKQSPLDLRKLLDDVRDRTVPGFLWFKGHRVCHYSADAVCAGFWEKYRNLFQLGQIAQRLKQVEYVQDSSQKGSTMSNKTQAKRRRREQAARLYTRNVLADALATTRGVVPATMEDAVAAANARLESKQLPLTYTKPVSRKVVAQKIKVRSAVAELTILSQRHDISEAQLTDAISEALQARRGAVTLNQLIDALAQPVVPSWKAQRRFVKWR